jgi:DNA sulfur modification protein DndE
MKFKPSTEVEEFIESVYARVGARNKAVLGRAGLFLALGQGVPAEFKPKDSQGKDLDDETVIGDELHHVIRAALNHRTGKTLDETGYRQEFRRYFEYGCLRLKQLWEESGNDQAHFIKLILQISGEDIQPEGKTVPHIQPLSVVESAVKLQLLLNTDDWILNEVGHNGLLVISGRPGMGKSQLALDLLAQVSSQGLRFIFFDLKGELEDDPTNTTQRNNRQKFLDITRARYIRLIQQDLPINPLVHSRNPTENAQIAYEIASIFRAYAPQLGTKQEQTIADAYQRLDPPDFIRLLNELERMDANGVELSITKKIHDLNLFASAFSAISAEEFLSTSLIIDFKDFGNDNANKSLVVALVLNFLIKRLNSNLPVTNNIQPLKMVLFVDEAHLLLPKEGKAGLLGILARQGRSWGFPVWLASQDANAFITKGNHAINFAELASCGIHFSPDTLSESEQKKILGSVVNRSLKQGEAVLRHKNKIETGQTRQFWRDIKD